MSKDYQHSIGIKIDDSEVKAKVLFCVKNATSFSLSVAKEKISENEYLMLVDATDLDEIRKINAFKRELSELGVETTMFLDDKEQIPEYFDNWVQTCEEASKEYDDFEY